jgi:hypothetical protein
MNGVLAYPHFFPPREWLRFAALCWDRIYTLCPDRPSPPDYVADFAENLPGVLDFIDARAFSSDAAVQTQFEEWLSAIGRRNASALTPLASGQSQHMMLYGLFAQDDWAWFEGLLERNGLIARGKEAPYRIPRWEFEPRVVYPEGTAGTDPHVETRLRFYEAVASGDRRSARQLLRSGLPSDMRSRLARLLDRRGASQVEFAQHVVLVPPEIPFHFLAMCAARAAGARGLDLATNGNEYTGTCHYDSRHLAADVALRVIEAFVPRELAEMDVQRIAQLRDELSTQRLQFQRDVQSLCDEFTKLFSEDSLRAAARRIEELAKARVEEARRAYRRARVEMVLKTFGMAVAPPALFTSVASMLGIGLFAPASIAAGLAFVIAQALAAKEQVRSVEAKAGWSYVLDVTGRLERSSRRRGGG